MSDRRSEQGWTWFEPQIPPENVPGDLTGVFARCFSGRDGERVLLHLRGMTLERSLGPDASDAALRHLEGQRQLIGYVLALVARGRTA